MTSFEVSAATIVGCIIGLNRELKHQSAGLRTHALVALGAALAWWLFDLAAGPTTAALTATFGPVSLAFVPPLEVAKLVALGAALGFAAGLWRGRDERVHALA